MVTVYLIFFTLSLIIFTFIRNNRKFFKTGKQMQVSKQAEAKQIACNHQRPGHLCIFVEVIKMIYWRYIQDIPNYEVAQGVMAKLGNIIVYKFPLGSIGNQAVAPQTDLPKHWIYVRIFNIEYQVIGDPVYAKSIMADPSWTEIVPIGYYLQDATFQKPYGLIFGGGKHWKTASRVTAKLLQQLGFFNPTTMEHRFVFEMEELEKSFNMELASNGGEHTFCPRDIFGYLSINVVFHILLGTRNPFDRAVVTKLMSSIFTMNKKLTPFVTLLEIVPFLRHFPKLTFLRSFHETSDLIYGIFREVIAEKRRVGNYKEHMEDFVDGMLEHVDKSEKSEEGLNEENMLVVLRDIIMAGADTTSATLEHALLFMSLHPEVQEKVQAEIDCVIGPDRVTAYADRRSMPYTEATLHEIYRLGSPVPAIARAKHKGNECSYAPISIYGIHRNVLFFDEPDKFNPDRFIDTVDPTKVVNTDNLIPFGYGRRSCPGEKAARVAVFVYFVMMLQKFSIRISSHHPPPSTRNCHGFSRSPNRYYITIRQRH